MSDLATILPGFPTTLNRPLGVSSPAPWYTYSLLPALELHRITVADLLTFEELDIAKWATVPILDVRKFAEEVAMALNRDVVGVGGDVDGGGHGNRGDAEDGGGVNDNRVPRNGQIRRRWDIVSMLDVALDRAIGGGIPVGYVTEITGESAAGKTQLLLTLLLAAQLPPPQGLSRNSIYIATEAPLATSRLSQLLDSHPQLSTLSGVGEEFKPSLARVLAIPTHDLESQDHVFNYQLPHAIRKYNVGLVVVDSIAANYRAEQGSEVLEDMASRATELTRLGCLLRELAREENVAIVVANQVSDRFHDDEDNIANDMTREKTRTRGKRKREADDLYPASSSPVMSLTPSPSAPPTTASSPNDADAIDTAGTAKMIAPPYSSAPLLDTRTEPPEPDAPQSATYESIFGLNFQQRFFTGWGDDEPHSRSASTSPLPSSQHQDRLKTPALGFTWTNQIACRIALKIHGSGEGDDDDRLVIGSPSPSVSTTQTDNSNDTIRSATFARSEPPLRSHNNSHSNSTIEVGQSSDTPIPTPPTKSSVSIAPHNDNEKVNSNVHTNTTTDSPRGNFSQTRRFLRLVFAPWAPPTPEIGGVEFEISTRGVTSSSVA